MARGILSKSNERWPRNKQPETQDLSTEKLAEWAERHAESASSVDRLARRWVSRVIAGLLALQAASLVAMNVARLARFDWESELADVMLSTAALDAVLIALFLLPLAFGDLIAAGGMWLERSWAWLWAMILQGMLLIFCLSSYAVNQRSNDIYFLMLTCIVLVLYLNTNDVRLAFTSRQSTYR